jgi:hypothetical protein
MFVVVVDDENTDKDDEAAAENEANCRLTGGSDVKNNPFVTLAGVVLLVLR